MKPELTGHICRVGVFSKDSKTGEHTPVGYKYMRVRANSAISSKHNMFK